jgi:hypothetical protein
MSTTHALKVAAGNDVMCFYDWTLCKLSIWFRLRKVSPFLPLLLSSLRIMPVAFGSYFFATSGGEHVPFYPSFVRWAGRTRSHMRNNDEEDMRNNDEDHPQSHA